jgi:hypothetical protein
MDGFEGAVSSFERYGGIDRQNPGIEGGRTRWRFSQARITFPCTGGPTLLAKATPSVVISKSEIY